MKKAFLILLAIAETSYLSAQKVKASDVPATVRSEFKTLNPTVTTAKWEKEDGNFESHYKQGKEKVTCVIEPSGKYVQTEVSINPAGLPKVINDYLAKNMPGKKVSEAAKITSSDGKVTYEAEVKDVDYTFGADGNFIKKETDND